MEAIYIQRHTIHPSGGLSKFYTLSTNKCRTNTYTKPLPTFQLLLQSHITVKMPSIVDQLGSLVSSIFHTITALLGSIVAVFQSILGAILGVIQTMFAAVGTAISGLAQTFEGLLKFLMGELNPQMTSLGVKLNSDTGNIVVIGGLVAAFFLYSMHQQRSNGRPITAAPAKQKKIN